MIKKLINLLNKKAEDWLILVLKDNGLIVKDNIIGLYPKPSPKNYWLYSPQRNTFEGFFKTDKEERFSFLIYQDFLSRNYRVTITQIS